MIRQEAADAARNMKQFLEVQFTPEQFNSWRKSIDSNKDWTEEEKDFLKMFVNFEEWLKTLAIKANKSDWPEKTKKAVLSLEKEVRRKMDSLR